MSYINRQISKNYDPSFKNTIVINRTTYYGVYTQNLFIMIVFLKEGALFLKSADLYTKFSMTFVIMLTRLPTRFRIWSDPAPA
jgi:hypothetical protein